MLPVFEKLKFDTNFEDYSRIIASNTDIFYHITMKIISVLISKFFDRS